MKKILILLILCTMSIPIFASAQSQVKGQGGGITVLENPIKFNSVNELIIGIIDLVLTIAIPLLVVVFVWLGFKFVMAQGKEAELKKVKNDLLYTLIGAGIIIGAKAIAELLQGTIESL